MWHMKRFLFFVIRTSTRPEVAKVRSLLKSSQNQGKIAV